MHIRCIYIIQNRINNHCYIGQTIHFKQRKSEHLQELRKGKHFNKYLQHAFDLYGEKNFIFQVLEELKAGIGITEREQYWIERLKPEYNSIQNVFEGVGHYEEREYDESHFQMEETFVRPSWHRKVYGDGGNN